MSTFKLDGEKTTKKGRLVKPVTAKIGPAFKDESSKVIDLLSKVDPKKLEDSFKKQGFFIEGRFKILPEHVEIVHREIAETGRRFIPHVIEPSFGSDRLAYVALEHAYTIKSGRVALKLPRDIAPIQLAVLPLVSKDGLPEKASLLYMMLIREGFTVEYDEAGSIGRRYARFDEVGTPLCVTVDYQTLEDETVTIRDRDSWKQVRAVIKDLPRFLYNYFRFKMDFEDMGSPLRK